MSSKLASLVILDCAGVVSCVLFYLKHLTLTLLYIGFLPLVLCNIIFVRECIGPSAQAKTFPPVRKASGWMRALPLLIMPVGFLVTLPALISFYNSLGWSPVVCFGFSVLDCLVIMSLYGGVKVVLNGTKADKPPGQP